MALRISSARGWWTIGGSLLLSSALVTAPVWAAPVAGTLTAVHAFGLSGNRVRIVLHVQGRLSRPFAFSVINPPYVALDLSAMRLAVHHEIEPIHIGVVRNVMLAAQGVRTRVVVNLRRMVPYRLSVHGQDIDLTLGRASRVQVAALAASQPSAVSPTAPSLITRILSLRFRRTAYGAGRIYVRLSSSSVTGLVHQVGNRLTVLFPHTHLRRNLRRRYLVTDFATPVRSFSARQLPDGAAEIRIRGVGHFQQLAFQTNRVFAVELKPLTAAALARLRQSVFTGRRISLDFQSIPVRAVLQILADVSKLNMVVADDVHGHITLRLHDVPWDQALHIILETEGLTMIRQGNVVMVGPAAVLAQRARLEAQSASTLAALSPLHTTFIPINYAKAGALASLIQGEKNLLGHRGSVSVDPRTNMLIVRDTRARLHAVRRMVRALDIPVKQVLISSRIVVANDTFTRALGAQIGLAGVHQLGSQSLLTTSGDLNGNNTIQQSALTNYNSTGSFFPLTPPALNDQLSVNVPATNPVGTLAVGILNSDYLVNLELSALQSQGLGEVVSSPRVITADQQKALIEQGVEIPYQEAASSGATAVAFKKAVLRLEVTPQITPDNRIVMAIEVRNDTVGQEVPTGTGGEVPAIDTRSVHTQVLVDNGDTVVLGGIYETTRNRTVDKVPLLGDIPLLGWLFRSVQVQNDKAELLVFVTPKILSSSLHAVH
ncbi:MAG: type IV pilus secretin PilQ family protein [Gammaproteobacteria bacterium]|jgi:type IV pilus assembly protein PilQ|nr:type IV pilus secretin PilQ family protein [Gammaproteobacteria bacterium]